MGMYDNITHVANCERCGEPLTDFQSKDGACLLQFLRPVDVAQFHTGCDRCGLWHDYFVDVTVRCVTELTERGEDGRPINEPRGALNAVSSS